MFQTDGHYEANSRFPQFWERPQAGRPHHVAASHSCVHATRTAVQLQYVQVLYLAGQKVIVRCIWPDRTAVRMWQVNINIKVVLTVKMAVIVDFNTEVLKLYACAFLEDGNRFSCRNSVCALRARIRTCGRVYACVCSCVRVACVCTRVRVCVCVCVSEKTRVIKILQYVSHRIKFRFVPQRTQTVCTVDTSQCNCRNGRNFSMYCVSKL